MPGTAQAVVLVVVVVAVLLLVAVAWSARVRARRQRELRWAFAGEYDRTLQEQGSRGRAEQELERRRERHDQLHLRDLPAESRARYLASWEELQTRFVDRPHNAVAEADELIRAAMTERGYPTESFEQQAADLSVEHAAVLDSYRTAHELTTRDRGDLSTEDLRRAMVHYRTLFTDLVGPDDPIRARHARANTRSE